MSAVVECNAGDQVAVAFDEQIDVTVQAYEQYNTFSGYKIDVVP